MAERPTVPLTLHSTEGQLLRITAAVALLGFMAGVMILPGARAYSGEDVVAQLEAGCSVLGLAAFVLSVSMCVRGVLQVFLRRSFQPLLSACAFFVVVGVMAVSPSLRRQGPFVLVLLTAFAGSVALVLASLRTLRAPATRVGGVLLGLLAAAGASRMIAFFFVHDGAREQDEQLVQLARWAGSIDLSLQFLALLVTLMWLATRGGRAGRLGANFAVLGTVLTCVWLFRDANLTTPTAVLVRNSLARYSMPPMLPSFVTVAAYRLIASWFVALACLLQWRRPAVLMASVAMLLLGSADFDVPLGYLLSSCAALWLCFAADDQRTLWADIAVLEK